MGQVYLAGGTVSTSAGWERDGDTCVVRRAMRLDARLARGGVLPPPMRHLSVSALVECPLTLMARLRTAFRERVSQLSLVGEGSFAFADGHEGRYLCLEMELLPGMRSRQLHVVRSDAGVTRHFVATVSGMDSSALDAELRPMIGSFRLAATSAAAV